MMIGDELGYQDIRRLDEIAQRTFDELAEIPTAGPDLEPLIQALSQTAERLSAVTYEILYPDEPEAISEGNE